MRILEGLILIPILRGGGFMSSGSKKEFSSLVGEFSFKTTGEPGLEFVIKENVIENIFWKYRMVTCKDGESKGWEMKVPWFS